MRQVREELYAGSGHLRRRLDDVGFRPFHFRGARDLPGLPTTELAELRAVPPEELVLRPSPRTMKELWPFGRKLALVMAGGRAARLLEEAYQPVMATEEDGLAVTWTRTDLELAGELGARVLALAGVTAGTRILSELSTGPSFASVLLERGARRLGADLADQGSVLVTDSGPGPDTREAERVVLLGAPPDPEARAAHEARGAAVVTCFTCGPTRVAAVEAPAGGHFLFPDLVAAELCDPDTLAPAPPGSRGELVLTHLGSHGTALLRFRTGVTAAAIDWTPCPRSGLRLPRVLDPRTRT